MHAMLERGLGILEFLACSDKPRSFGDINRALGDISRASLTRLLNSLIETGYIHKEADSGLYACGGRMGVFSALRDERRTRFLIQRYQPLMEEIAEEYGVSLILQERVGDVLICIKRVASEFSAVMQVEGHVNREMNQPWGLLMAAYDPEIAATVADETLRELHPRIRELGYYYCDQKLRRNFRRLGFPVFDESGTFLGCLGLGGSILEITDESLPVMIDSIQNRLEQLR